MLDFLLLIWARAPWFFFISGIRIGKSAKNELKMRDLRKTCPKKNLHERGHYTTNFGDSLHKKCAEKESISVSLQMFLVIVSFIRAVLIPFHFYLISNFVFSKPPGRKMVLKYFYQKTNV